MAEIERATRPKDLLPDPFSKLNPKLVETEFYEQIYLQNMCPCCLERIYESEDHRNPSALRGVVRSAGEIMIIPLNQELLAWHIPSFHPRLELVTVTRYTETQIVCQTRSGGTRRFNRRNGSERGGGYGSHVTVVTPEILAEINVRELSQLLARESHRLEDAARAFAQKKRAEDKPEIIAHQLDQVREWASQLEGWSQP